MPCKLKSKKAPGPDGLNAEIIKAAVQSKPQNFLNMFKQLLKKEAFPRQWKFGKLVLLEKEKLHQEKKA